MIHVPLAMSLFAAPAPAPAPDNPPAAAASVAAAPGAEDEAITEISMSSEGSSLTTYPLGARLFAAVDEANLRQTADPAAPLVQKLLLGTPLRILEVGAAPVRVGKREDRWYRVHTEPHLGQAEFEGFLFGAVITPLCWQQDLNGDGKPEILALSLVGEMAFQALLYDPTRKKTLQEPLALHGLTEGTLSARIETQRDGKPAPFTRVVLSTGGETTLAYVGSFENLGDGPSEWLEDGALKVAGWAYEKRGGKLRKSYCANECRPTGYVGWSTAHAMFDLPEREVEEGPDRGPYPPTSCSMIGAMGKGKSAPRVIACEVVFDDSKSGAPSRLMGARYIKEGSTWTRQSYPYAQYGVEEEVDRLLERRGVSMGGISSDGDIPPETLFTSAYGSLVWEGHFAESGGELTLPEYEVFRTYEYGPVVTIPSASGTSMGDSGMFFVPRPASEGGAWGYRYEPALEGASFNDGAIPADARYVTGRRTCSGGVVLDAIQAGMWKLKSLRQIGSAGELPIYAPKDLKGELTRQGAEVLETVYTNHGNKTLDPNLEMPFIYVPDPWGRLIRMVREEAMPTSMCEPVMYVYRTSSEPVTVTLGSAVGVWHSEPRTLDGPRGSWRLVGSPSGEVRTLAGERYPFLFWEGASEPIAFPARAAVVSRADTRRYLREQVVARGLVGREVDEFLQAWATVLERNPYNLVAFHPRALIDAVAPLRVDPSPDTMLRVLLDFRPLSSPIDYPAAEPAPAPPGRAAYTVVEWGGLERASPGATARATPRSE